MTDLATRIEQAGEGNRELDRLVAVSLLMDGPWGAYETASDWLKAAEQWNIPHYTTSIDAAATLVPVGYAWLRKSPGAMTVYKVPTDDKEWAQHIDGTAATPALALCAAAIRARGL